MLCQQFVHIAGHISILLEVALSSQDDSGAIDYKLANSRFGQAMLFQQNQQIHSGCTQHVDCFVHSNNSKSCMHS